MKSPITLVLPLLLTAPIYAQFFIDTTSQIRRAPGPCTFYAYASTTADPGPLGSVSNGITGMGYGYNNGNSTTTVLGDPITFTNRAPDRTVTNGYPMSANISHSWAAFLGGTDNVTHHPYVYANCPEDPPTGGGDTDCEGSAGDSDVGWTTDPLNEDPCDSPILIDVDGDGEILCGGADTSIWFDLWGSGEPILINWIQPETNDAFLVHDINANGIVDDGSELFGSGTRLLLEDKLALNGFLGLAQFDQAELGGNEDSYIGPSDQIWRDLYIWNDRNANGFSESGELTPLNRAGVRLLNTVPIETRTFDEHGNWFRYWSDVTIQAKQHTMIDVFFKRHN